MKTNFKGSLCDTTTIKTINGYCVGEYLEEENCQLALFDTDIDIIDKSNAELFTHALEVRQQIPFDLPELLHQRNEAIKLIKELRRIFLVDIFPNGHLKTELPDILNTWDNVNQLLNKIQQDHE